MSEPSDVLRVRLFSMQCQTLFARRLRGALGQWNRCVRVYETSAVRAVTPAKTKIGESTLFYKSPKHKPAGATLLTYMDKAVETEDLSSLESSEWSAQWPADSSSSDAHSAQWQRTDSCFAGGDASQSSGASSWPPSISASQLSSSDPSEHSSEAEETQMNDFASAAEAPSCHLLEVSSSACSTMTQTKEDCTEMR